MSTFHLTTASAQAVDKRRKRYDARIAKAEAWFAKSKKDVVAQAGLKIEYQLARKLF